MNVLTCIVQPNEHNQWAGHATGGARVLVARTRAARAQAAAAHTFSGSSASAGDPAAIMEIRHVTHRVT